MNVLLLAVSDWAGMGSLLCQSLCKVGVNAKIHTTKRGKYKHPSVSINRNQALDFSKKCHVIQYMHSVKHPLNINLKNKKVVVFHGGGKFRFDYKNICKIFNPIVDCSIIQTYDLFGLGAKNEIWLLPPIDNDKIKPIYETKGNRIIVGHYPSSALGKGSDNVNKIINNIRGKVPDFEYRYSSERVSWDKQIKRMSQVDIYIERMSLKNWKNSVSYRTGVWGITALEAAALGKVVVTNFYGKKIYRKQYGEYALQVADSEKQMEKLLIKLLSLPKKELMILKQNTRKWVEEKHSLESIGNRLRGIYERL